jgi:hypothetical protein
MFKHCSTRRRVEVVGGCATSPRRPVLAQAARAGTTTHQNQVLIDCCRKYG